MSISRQPASASIEAFQKVEDDQETGPRARTRRLMLTTAIQLMQDGLTPSVRDVAEAAGVSRATAYRYFPSQAALVQAVISRALGPITQWSSTSEDPEERVEQLIAFSLPRIEEFEATFRAVMKLTQEHWARRHDNELESGTRDEMLPFRRHHRIALLESAIAPLRSKLSNQEFSRLVHGLSMIFGIESLTVMKDICGRQGGETTEMAIWSARALVRHAIAERGQEDSK